jgi:hypothetical protein
MVAAESMVAVESMMAVESMVAVESMMTVERSSLADHHSIRFVENMAGVHLLLPVVIAFLHPLKKNVQS